MRTATTTTRRAFSLIELMVVIGIIALLVTIALPTAFSLVTQSRTRQTLATFKVIDTAIAQFVSGNIFSSDLVAERPMRQDRWKLNDGTFNSIFGRYPPSPTAAFAEDRDTLANYPATEEEEDGTKNKFLRLLNVMQGYDPSPLGNAHWKIQHDAPPNAEYPSIECLIYALREFSPDARSIIDKLPSGTLDNRDRDYAYFDSDLDGTPDPGERTIELPEVLDAFPDLKLQDARKKTPIRFVTRERWEFDSTDQTVGVFRWELRSAGPDSVFAPPFTEEKLCDDVILQGP